MDSPEQVKRYLDTVRFSEEELMRAGAYNRVALYLGEMSKRTGAWIAYTFIDYEGIGNVVPFETELEARRYADEHGDAAVPFRVACVEWGTDLTETACFDAIARRG